MPIFLSVPDYKNKTGLIGERFMPTGDIVADMEYIHQYYVAHNPTARHPKQFTTDCVRV